MARPQIVRLTKRLAEVLRRGHPWVFRDALAEHEAAPGTVMTIVDRRGGFIARGLAEAGPIAVRVMTTIDEPIDAALIRRRIDVAVALRDAVVPADTEAYRLLHGEGDGLPGFVCDIYGRFATVALDGEAAPRWQAVVLEALRPVLDARDVEAVLVRRGRRAERRVEAAWGEVPAASFPVRERGMVMMVDLWRGQKTGLFLDQRDTRAVVRSLAKGRRVADLYAYVGGFSAAAGLGGATRVDTVDAAGRAIKSAARTWEKNLLPPDVQHLHAVDVERFLTQRLTDGTRYDLVIADPPSFAPRKSARDGALIAYRKLHEACLRLLAPGGIIVAASCSSHVTAADFDAALLDASAEAAVRLQVLQRFGAPPDHPRLLAFPEGDYLKVVVARVFPTDAQV